VASDAAVPVLGATMVLGAAMSKEALASRK
jgi:hypothetical protein